MKPSDPGATCYIGLDIGTTALKGVLTDGRCRILAEATADHALLHPREGWVELVPEAHYQNICAVIRDVVAAAPGAVKALAMAAAAGNTLLTDAEGVPLMNIVSWMDERAARQPPKALRGLTGAAVARITGWPCVSSFPLAQLAWLREHEPSRLAAASHVGMDTDWLLHRLTGEWCMDHSTATTFHLQDQVLRRYHAPLQKRIGVEEGTLSRLVPSGSIVGPLTAEASRDTGLSRETLVVAGCFDHPAAARAANVVEPGQLMLSCGTSWVGFMPHMDRQRLLDAQLLVDPFLSQRGGPWGGMFSVPRIGRKIDWYIDQLIAPGAGRSERVQAFNSYAAEAAPGAGGVVIDLRATPRPVRASRANIARAVMESAATLINGKILELRRHGMSFGRAVMVGGPSRSPVWPDVVAAITGLEIAVAGRSAGARGAALLAADGVGDAGVSRG